MRWGNLIMLLPLRSHGNCSVGWLGHWGGILSFLLSFLCLTTLRLFMTIFTNGVGYLMFWPILPAGHSPFSSLNIESSKTTRMLCSLNFSEDISQDIREDNLNEFYAHIKSWVLSHSKVSCSQASSGLNILVWENHTETADMLKSVWNRCNHGGFQLCSYQSLHLGDSHPWFHRRFWGSAGGVQFGGEMGAAADIEKIKEQLGRWQEDSWGIWHYFSFPDFSLFVMFPTSVMQKNRKIFSTKSTSIMTVLPQASSWASHAAGHFGVSNEQGDVIGESKTFRLTFYSYRNPSQLTQQMTEVANHYAQLLNPPSNHPNAWFYFFR